MESLKVATFNVCKDVNKRGNGPSDHTFTNLMAVTQKLLGGNLVDLKGKSVKHPPLSKAYAFACKSAPAVKRLERQWKRF